MQPSWAPNRLPFFMISTVPLIFHYCACKSAWLCYHPSYYIINRGAVVAATAWSVTVAEGVKSFFFNNFVFHVSSFFYKARLHKGNYGLNILIKHFSRSVPFFVNHCVHIYPDVSDVVHSKLFLFIYLFFNLRLWCIQHGWRNPVAWETFHLACSFVNTFNSHEIHLQLAVA